MGMRVSTNIAAINAQRNLFGSQNNIQDSLAKLASGSRINKSADDAAGLAISENLKAEPIIEGGWIDRFSKYGRVKE